MGRIRDIQIVAAELYLLPVELRVPLKFGDQVLACSYLRPCQSYGGGPCGTPRRRVGGNPVERRLGVAVEPTLPAP